MCTRLDVTLMIAMASNSASVVLEDASSVDLSDKPHQPLSFNYPKRAFEKVSLAKVCQVLVIITHFDFHFFDLLSPCHILYKSC